MAYRAWHCGNEDEDCFGTELEPHGNSAMHCPACGRVYDSGDGKRLPDEEG